MTVLTEENLTVPASPSELFTFDRDTLIREAVEIAQRTGAGIVPLVDKVARLKDWQNNPKKTERQIRDSLSNPWVNGAGVLLPDGFCVVDTDTPEAEKWARENLPTTFTVKTKKGYHRYYSTPGPIKQSRSGIREGVDVLSRRNYAVYVGSIHPDTKQVEYFHTDSDAEINALPDWLYQKLKPDQGSKVPTQRKPKETSHSGSLPTAPASAVENAREVITFIKQSRPNTLANLEDTSDGRDNRVYRVVCSLLQSGCGDVDDVVAVLSQFPLWEKVTEQEDPTSYITHKVESAQRFIEENPAEMTVRHWRRRVAGAQLKPGLMKVLDAIGFEAFRLTKMTGNEATRLTLSKRKVALNAAMTPSTALRWMQEGEKTGWMKRVSNPSKGSGFAPAYLLTVPRVGSVGEIVSVDVGHDVFRHGVLSSALPIYKELHRGSGKVKELADRTKATENTTRRNLNKLKEAKVADKEKMVWSLTEDHETALDVYAVEVGIMGKREQQKEQYQKEQEMWKQIRRAKEKA